MYGERYHRKLISQYYTQINFRVLLSSATNQAPRNYRRDHPEQAARDCWLELNAAVTLNSKYNYSEKGNKNQDLWTISRVI